MIKKLKKKIIIKGIIFDWVGTLYRRNTVLFNGVIPTLETLKSKYKLGLVSLADQCISNRIQDIQSTGI